MYIGKKIIWDGVNQGVYCDYLLEARAWVTKDNVFNLKSVCYHDEHTLFIPQKHNNQARS